MCSARPVVPAACIFFRRRATGAASARPSLRPRFPERAVLQQSSDANCAARPMTRICAWPAVPRRRRRSCRGRMPWCCRTGLNCRPLPYQGSALPLSYGSKGTGGDGPEGRDRTRAVLATRSPPAQARLVRFSGKDVSVMHRKGAKDLRNRSEIARSQRILAVGRPWRPQCPGRAGNSPSGQATAGRAEPSVCVANASWLSHLRPQLCLWYGVTGGRG